MVDPKSYQLAQYFLADFKPVSEMLKIGLAQIIQNASDDWIIRHEKAGLLVEAED